MRAWVTLRWLFVLLLLSACAKTELPVNVAETLSPTALPTESPASTADFPSHLWMNVTYKQISTASCC